jgi:transposase
MAKSTFTKTYDDKDLYVKQIRIKADKTKMKQRKSLVDHPFGTIKRNMDGEYCLTKGLKNVLGEFSLTFLAYNIKRAINIMGIGRLIEGMA